MRTNTYLRPIATDLCLILAVSSMLHAQTPIINSISPISAQAGTVLRVWGEYFQISGGPQYRVAPSDDPVRHPTLPPSDYTAVYFSSTVVSPSTSSATYLEVTIPSISPGTYALKVANMYGLSNAISFTVVAPPPPPPPSRNLTWLHGLGGSANSWEATKNVMASEFYVNSTNFSYPNVDPLHSVAMNYHNSIPVNSIVIGSSQGGLIPREMVRLYGTDRVSALITVGTPHRSAPIVNNVTNIGMLTEWWISDLAQGWYVLFGGSQESYAIAQYYLSGVAQFLAQSLQPLYNINNPSTVDMKPGSAFLQGLNANPAATMPAATYAIYGLEDWNTVWRLADAHFSSNSVETGAAIRANHQLQSFYYWASAVSIWIADYYFWRYYEEYDPDYYYLAMYWNSVSNAFYWGYYSLAFLQQSDYDYHITGSRRSDRYFADLGTTWWSDDAIVPIWSEMNPYIVPTRRMAALGVNHDEQTNHDAVRNWIRTLLLNNLGVAHR